MFIECSEAQKAFRRTESPLWWAGELPEPRCQGFLLGEGAANNDEKGRAVRACCGLVRHFYDGIPRRQGREWNTDHACLISCQYDCTKSSYNDLNFVQKHSDHPLHTGWWWLPVTVCLSLQATCAVNGREEPSFGRRRRRSVPEEGKEAAGAEPTQEPVLPDTNSEPADLRDEDLADPEEEGENVKQLFSVSRATVIWAADGGLYLELAGTASPRDPGVSDSPLPVIGVSCAIVHVRTWNQTKLCRHLLRLISTVNSVSTTQVWLSPSGESKTHSGHKTVLRDKRVFSQPLQGNESSFFALVFSPGRFQRSIPGVETLAIYMGRIIQTEAERWRREAEVKQPMKIRLRSCMYAYIHDRSRIFISPHNDEK